MADERIRADFQELTLPLHRDLGRIEGRLAGLDGRIGGVETRVLRNEALTEEGFRLAASAAEKSNAVIEQKVDDTELRLGKKIDAVNISLQEIAIAQAADAGKSRGSRGALWTTGSICVAVTTIVMAALNLILHH